MSYGRRNENVHARSLSHSLDAGDRSVSHDDAPQHTRDVTADCSGKPTRSVTQCRACGEQDLLTHHTSPPLLPAVAFPVFGLNISVVDVRMKRLNVHAKRATKNI